MPTPAERKALVFLAALAALGVAARGFLDRPGRAQHDGAAGEELGRQIAAVDAASASSRSKKGKPGAAPSGSKRDSSKRASSRPGATPRGEGNGGGDDNPLALYEARRLAVERSNAQASARVAERAAELAAELRPGVRDGRVPTSVVSPGSAPQTSSRPVDMDTADADLIETIPGIGPALAARIVEDRRLRGAFGSLEGLQRVRGVGRALAGKIRAKVTFSRPLSAPPTLVPVRPKLRGRRRP